jgi:phosphoribosylamine---glycine ligase
MGTVTATSRAGKQRGKHVAPTVPARAGGTKTTLNQGLTMPNILLIGNGAREHALAECLSGSPQTPRLYSFMKANNPGIAALSERVHLAGFDDVKALCDFALAAGVSFAVVGPEEPLQNGAVDVLAAAGIPSVGPTKNLARLETSKSFTRHLLTRYGIPGNPAFQTFDTVAGIEDFLHRHEGVVIKPDGLTGGKGVMVQGDHFATTSEALALCRDILQRHPSVTIEERLDGEEFSLQCLCDGHTVVAMPAVQDHKRRFPDDKGPNTGGMGSYSCADHFLPFLTPDDVAAGVEITRRVAEAILRETGTPYRGIMYGGFMATKSGVKLLEYNARFGDPEAMNVMPLLESDFVEICRAVIDGTLSACPVSFARKATVCKYLVPRGYGLPPDHPDVASTAAPITVGDVGQARLYFSSVDKRGDGLYMSSSRAIALVGIAERLEDAERIAEAAVGAITGPVDHRPDIGTADLIEKRVAHMRRLRAAGLG